MPEREEVMQEMNCVIEVSAKFVADPVHAIPDKYQERRCHDSSQILLWLLDLESPAWPRILGQLIKLDSMCRKQFGVLCIHKE